MKHGRTRDRLARQLGILCFEMEAAGLMDNFPCLVVRGICDYFDAQKHKSFQKYAALTAAAYAADLLSTIPVMSTPLSQGVELDSVAKHRKSIRDSLRFDEAETRRAAIKNAHIETCRWLLQQSEYQDWLDCNKMAEHRGFLWIKGKPGTGKSTLMKFAVTHIERTMSKELTSISFFFNARGRELEKSTVGMYRSLLLQVFEKLPRLQAVLDSLKPSATPGQWDLKTLKETFRYAVEKLEQQHLVCFESLGHRTVSSKTRLRVCLSSRHYPYILISAGLQLTLRSFRRHI